MFEEAVWKDKVRAVTTFCLVYMEITKAISWNVHFK